jgi:nudix-type nucleoside diphosphatase (YffH/AdpP family)
VRQRVVIESTERILDGFFKVERAVLRHERFDGRMSAPLTRLLFERGDAVAVLPYDPQRRQVVLVQQFRYPAYVRAGPGWLWEIIAGMQEEGQTPEEVARREALEEAGCRLNTLQHLMTVYPSPGASAERVHIYLAAFTPQQRVAPGGGLPEDGEDIRVQEFDLDEAWRMVADGRIVDAKTILALQYLALHPDAL